jgi:DNA-binding transcriptional LysR family regulator
MFHPDLRLLRSFVTVAAEGSVTRAAELLHLTQPTVSGQLKELEQAVEHVLFHRTTRSISLSPAGKKLLPAAQRVIAEAEALRDLVEAMQGSGRTQFRLGAALYTLEIPEKAALIDAFSMRHPGIGFTIDNRLQSAQIPDMLSDRLDVALLLGVNAPHAADARDEITPIFNETQYPDTLERVILRRQPMSLLVPRDSELAEQEVIARAQLGGLSVAMLNREHGKAISDPLEAFFIESGAELVIPAEGNALAVERYAAQHGICGVGTGWFSPPAALVSRPVEGFDLYLDFAVVLGPGANHAARQFFGFAQKWQAARDGAAMAA